VIDIPTAFVAVLASFHVFCLLVVFVVRRSSRRRPFFLEAVGRGLAGAVVLLLWDAAFAGACMASFLVCPIWFVVSLARSAIKRPGWRLALARAAIPVLTLALALANDAVQSRVAESNARRVIAACEAYREANGGYPKGLDELAPRYPPSVPPAKHCLGPWNRFRYFYGENHSSLFWYVLPPYGRKIWNFEDRRWSYLD